MEALERQPVVCGMQNQQSLSHSSESEWLDPIVFQSTKCSPVNHSNDHRKVKISKVAAATLINQDSLDPKQLKMYVAFLKDRWSQAINQSPDMQSIPL
jgi:hypothetical protein